MPAGFTVIVYAGAVSVSLGTVRISGCRFVERSGFLLRCLESRSYNYNIQTEFIFFYMLMPSLFHYSHIWKEKRKKKKLCITANTNIAVSLHASYSPLITITECASVSQRTGAAVAPRRILLCFGPHAGICCFVFVKDFSGSFKCHLAGVVDFVS